MSKEIPKYIEKVDEDDNINLYVEKEVVPNYFKAKMTDDELRIALYDVTEDFYNVISSNDPIDVREELNSFIRRLNEIKDKANI